MGLSYGKLRGAWTRVGSDANPYLLTLTYTSADPYFGNPRFAVPNTVTNPEPEARADAGLGSRHGDELVRRPRRSRRDLLPEAHHRPDPHGLRRAEHGLHLRRGQRGRAVEQGHRGAVHRYAGQGDRPMASTGTSRRTTRRTRTSSSRCTATRTTYLVGSKFFNVSIEARVGQPYGSIVGRDFRVDSATGKKVLSSSSGASLAATTTTVLGNIQPDVDGWLHQHLPLQGLRPERADRRPYRRTAVQRHERVGHLRGHSRQLAAGS